MLIGIGCFGLWHRHLALTVNCSFLSHLAKELKPAIFWVRIRHLKKNVHIGKPLRSAEWKKGAGSRMLYTPLWSDGISKKGTKMALWFPDTPLLLSRKCTEKHSGLGSLSPLPSILDGRSYPSSGPSTRPASCVSSLRHSHLYFCRIYGAPWFLWQRLLLGLQALCLLVLHPLHVVPFLCPLNVGWSLGFCPPLFLLHTFILPFAGEGHSQA